MLFLFLFLLLPNCSSKESASVYANNLRFPAPINSRLNVVVRSPTPFGLGQNGCWPSRGSQLPRALPLIFSLCCPQNVCRRAAHSIYKIGRLFSLFLFSCPTLTLLRLLILLLLLMSVTFILTLAPSFLALCALEM